MASAARSRWILAVVLIAGIAMAWWMRRRPSHYAAAYVGERTVTLWSTTAQVRQIVATLGYGDQVAVIRQAGDQTEIRTPAGAQGWVDTNLLMQPEMWRRLSELVDTARSMPVQAVGHTRALSNVHFEPGRDAQRIFQFGANVPLLVLDRRSVPLPVAAGVASPEPAELNDLQSKPPGRTTGGEAEEAAAQESRQGPQEPGPKEPTPNEEDWLFVLRIPQQSSSQSQATAATSAPASYVASAQPVGVVSQASNPTIAGWILARFVELDPPPPIPDYASAAAMRVVAWVVLNSVPDAEGEKPQYLVAGTHSAENSGCEFNAFRVFTWDARRQRYETAYIANGVCGRLPIRVQQTSRGAQFRFHDPGGEPGEQPGEENNQRVYRLTQTVVRVVKPDTAQSEPREARSPARSKRL